MMKTKNAAKAIAVIVVVGLIGAAVAVVRGMSPAAVKAIPTAHVQQGRVQVTVYTVGELRGTRAVQLAKVARLIP